MCSTAAQVGGFALAADEALRVSAVCQTRHWWAHRPACSAARNGRWSEATFANAVYPREVPLARLPEELYDVDELATQWRNDAPPPNVHGEHMFLVKLQRPASPDAQGGIVMYDRMRSVTGHIMKDANENFWEEILKKMPFESSVGSMYFWARRIGVWRIAVCVDCKVDNQGLRW